MKGRKAFWLISAIVMGITGFLTIKSSGLTKDKNERVRGIIDLVSAGAYVGLFITDRPRYAVTRPN